MSLIIKTINSKILKKEMKLAVYCPDSFNYKALPVLYFLHGRTEQMFRIIFLREITA